MHDTIFTSPIGKCVSSLNIIRCRSCTPNVLIIFLTTWVTCILAPVSLRPLMFDLRLKLLDCIAAATVNKWIPFWCPYYSCMLWPSVPQMYYCSETESQLSANKWSGCLLQMLHQLSNSNHTISNERPSPVSSRPPIWDFPHVCYPCIYLWCCCGS